MTPVGMIAFGFAIVAFLCLLALAAITASESIHWGYISARWTLWRSKRKQAKEQRRARRVSLPKAYLVEPGAYEVVSLRSVAKVRVK